VAACIRSMLPNNADHAELVVLSLCGLEPCGDPGTAAGKVKKANRITDHLALFIQVLLISLQWGSFAGSK